MAMLRPDRPEQGGSGLGEPDRGIGEHQLGEADREAGVGDASHGPVDERGAVGCDEQVERVEVAVGDHSRRRTWFGGDEPLGRRRDVGSPEGLGVVGLFFDEPGRRGGQRGVERVELLDERLGVEVVELRRDASELICQVANEVGDLRSDGPDAEPGHGWLAVEGVHDDEVPAEWAGLVGREPDRRRGEALVGHGALDGGLRDAGVSGLGTMRATRSRSRSAGGLSRRKRSISA